MVDTVTTKDLLKKYRPQVFPEALPEAAQVPPEFSATQEAAPPVGLKSLMQKYAPAASSTLEPVVEPADLAQQIYSENDLAQDNFFIPIQAYMVDRFGEHMRTADRADVVDKFVNNMRGFEAGNSVRSVNEIVYLNEVGEDEARLATAGEAYKIYQGMQGIFGDTTTGEKAGAVWDYVRSTVADPINLAGLGIAKVATGTGFKMGSRVAMVAAKRAFEKKLAKGATREVAQKTGEAIFARVAKTEAAKVATKIAERQAVEQSAKTTLGRMTTSIALKEAAITGTFDSAVAAGTDYLYQDAMLRTKVQEEYNVYQTGLSAVVGLVAGGIAGAASNIGTGTTGLVAPPNLKVSTKGNKTLGKLVQQGPTQSNPNLPAGNWLADVAKGKELNDQDTEFFITMLLGNDDKGLKGLAQIAVEEGITWVKRNEDDKVSNFIGDLIKKADPQDAKQFLKDFTKATGISMDQGKKLTLEGLADTFKRKMSGSASTLNAARQMSDILGGNLKGRTVDDYIEAVVDGVLPDTTSGTRKAIGGFVDKLVNRDLPDLQSNLIRLMVANPSTTAMNITGYAAVTGLNSATDIARAVLLGGKAGLYLAYKPAEAKKAGITALNLLQNQAVKARSILDINTTYDQYLLYSQARPKALSKLTTVMSGGIETTDKSIKGFNPDTPLLTLKANQIVDVVQSTALGDAQDGLTKSIEFMSQLDKLMRRSREEGGYGMSYKEFFSNTNLQNTNAAAKMMSERYIKLEAMAVDETLKATFSKSYAGQGLVGEVAGLIENARKIPGVGLLVPFGKFFNNTVALAYETTAIGPLISRIGGKTGDKTLGETFIRGAVTWGLIYEMAKREQDYIDLGLGWSEETDDETGEIIDEKYEFPYGLYKAVARTLAHRMRGEGIPAELGAQFLDQFGLSQLTRQLGDAGEGLGSIASALISEDGPSLADTLKQTLGSIPTQAVSAATRPLEPINAIIGLARGKDFYVPDRKQGAKAYNNAFRYFDQGIALAKGENLPRANTAAEGEPRQNVSKLFSTTRASRLTATEQVMNAIGRPTWVANMSSESEAADNRYNELFNKIVDKGAATLWASESFQKGDLEQKQLKVNNLLRAAVAATKDYMGSVAARSGDATLLKMINISNKPEITVQRVLKDLGIDRGLDELSSEELDTVENMIKYREEILNIRE